MNIKILLTGIPGSGKTTSGRHLQSEHGFRHIEVETDEKFHRDLHSKMMPDFEDKDIVISFGFNPKNCIGDIEYLKTLGFSLVWLDGDRDIALKHYKERNEKNDPANLKHHLENFHMQIEKINETEIISSIKPIEINVFDDKLGKFKDQPVIINQILSASPAHQNEINRIKEQLNFLFGVFVVYDELRDNESIDSKLKKILVTSLGRTYLNGLAALTDKSIDIRGNENLSIHRICLDNSQLNYKSIEKIRAIRNKLTAHNDRKTTAASEEFLKEVNLGIHQSKELLLDLIKVIEKTSKQKMPIEDIEQDYILSIKKYFAG
jgi:gluconate kinase